jgi:hypothetical protein
MKLRISPLVATLLGVLVGCGGSVQSGVDTAVSTATDGGVGGSDAPATNPVSASDAGATEAAPETAPNPVSTTYPAFKPDMPQLQNNGGSVLKTPTVVTVTWSSDANAAYYEAFGDGLSGSSYWKTIVGEYGVGDVVSGSANHVSLTTAPPTSWADSDIATWVAQQASSATSGFPAPTGETIYVLYLPPGTSLQVSGAGTGGGGGDACMAGVGGYHQSATTSDGKTSFTYAVIPPCNFTGAVKDDATFAASHEIGEAATDPFTDASSGSPTGFWGVDDAHLVWDIYMALNVENGDMCEVYQDSALRSTEKSLSGYALQRLWSNASAAAGHNPCVPVPSAPYFNVTPLDVKQSSVDLSKTSLAAYGVTGTAVAEVIETPIGKPTTFTVGLYSDGPTDPWNISVKQGSSFRPVTSPNFTFATDISSGQNGQKATITVTANTYPTSRRTMAKQNYAVIYVASTDASGIEHDMPILAHIP